jgi:hypothetical protein
MFETTHKFSMLQIVSNPITGYFRKPSTFALDLKFSCQMCHMDDSNKVFRFSGNLSVLRDY